MQKLWLLQWELLQVGLFARLLVAKMGQLTHTLTRCIRQDHKSSYSRQTLHSKELRADYWKKAQITGSNQTVEDRENKDGWKGLRESPTDHLNQPSKEEGKEERVDSTQIISQKPR